jgi:hypothetical protein
MREYNPMSCRPSLYSSRNPLRTLTSDGPRVKTRIQQKEILSLGHAIALQAVELPSNEHHAFIRSEVANLRQSLGPIYPDEKLLDNMEEWVTEIVKILAGDNSRNGADQGA